MYSEPMVGNQVHTTTDYSMFKPIKGNRTKNQLHLKRLIKSMEDKYLYTILIVNEKHEIIDGQHRFQAIKQLGLPVNYVICHGYSLDEVHIFNQNSKTWNASDYLAGYCGMGKQDYLIYKDFKDKYGYGHNETTAMLTGCTRGGGSILRAFKEGSFKVTHLQQATKYAEMIRLISEFYDGFNRRSFVYAMLTLFKKPQFEFVEFVKKLKIQPTAMCDCSDADQYISLIEEIYNYRRKNKVNLRF